MVAVAKIGTDDAGYNQVGAPQARLTIAKALADLASMYDAATPTAPKTISIEPGTYTTPAFALPPNVFIEADPDAQGGSDAEVIILLTGNVTLDATWAINTTAVGGFRGVTFRKSTSQILDLTVPTPLSGNPTRTLTLNDVRTDALISYEATSSNDAYNLKDLVYDGANTGTLEFSGGTGLVRGLDSSTAILFNDTAALAASINAHQIYTVATPSAVAPGVTFASSTGGMLARMGFCDNRALTLNRAGAAALDVYADAVSIPLAANITYSGSATSANLHPTTDAGAIVVINDQGGYLALIRDMLREYTAPEWRPSVAVAPTITVALAAGPNTTNIPGSVYVAGTDPRMYYTGMGYIAASGGGFPDNMYLSAYGNITGAFNSSVAYLEFFVTGLEFEIFGGAGTYLFAIDGQFINLLGTTLGTAGQVLVTKFAFTSNPGVHRFQIYTISKFGGIHVETTTSYWPTLRKPLVCMWVGDSFGEGTGQYFGMNQSICQKFGWVLCNSSSGGTGYTTGGSIPGRFSYIDRIQDVAAVKPDILVVQGSVNDGGACTEAIAGAYYDAVAAMLPQTQIVAVAPTWKNSSGYTANVGTSRDAQKAACATRGIPFIDTAPPGSDYWFTDANSFAFFDVGNGFAGTAVLAGDTVASVTVVNGGTGFAPGPSNQPALTQALVFTGGGGSGAAGFGVITYTLQWIDVIDGGQGYTSAPAVAIAGGATATAVIAGGRVVGVTVTAPGGPYTAPPLIVFSGGGGTGAQAAGYIVGTIASVTMTNNGTGYLTPPAVSLGPIDPTHFNQNGGDLYGSQFAQGFLEVIR